MKAVDWLILAGIGCIVAAAIISIIHKRKNGGSCCGCSGCSLCGQGKENCPEKRENQSSEDKGKQ